MENEKNTLKNIMSPKFSSINDKKIYLYKFFKKKDLKHFSKDGYDFYIIPKQYYLWKGINTTDNRNKKVDINSKNTDNILENLSSFFFADKETASYYGTKKDNGVDLQFKIIEDIVLLDISSINTVIKLFDFFKKIEIEQVINNPYLLQIYNIEKDSWNKSKKLKEVYQDEKSFFEKKWKVNMRELITDTLGNYEPKRINGKISSPKTPRKIERKSDEFLDKELVNLICSFKNIQINGWIFFKQIDEDFHNEIMICNPYGYIEYIDYHKM